MIHWLVQTLGDHPDLSRGMPPPGLLSASESARLAQLRVAKRRRDWLLGRWTAKHLLQATLGDEFGVCLPLNAYTIANDPSGAPLAAFDAGWDSAERGQARLGGPESLSLSISHSDDHAFCALSLMEHSRVGADIERIEERSTAFQEQYFTNEEMTAAGAVPPDLQPALGTLLWSAKEAALKALHLGLSVDSRCVCSTIALPAEQDDAVPLGYLWSRFDLHLDPHLWAEAGLAGGDRELHAIGWWQIMSNYVLTMVLIY